MRCLTGCMGATTRHNTGSKGSVFPNIFGTSNRVNAWRGVLLGLKTEE